MSDRTHSFVTFARTIESEKKKNFICSSNTLLTFVSGRDAPPFRISLAFSGAAEKHMGTPVLNK